MTLKITRNLLSGLAFWPKVLLRRAALFFSPNSLKIISCQLDRAFYVQGELIVLQWEVSHAWLVRIRPQGGFYPGSGSAVFIAEPNLKEITLIARGPGGRQKLRIPVFVKPFARKGRMARLNQFSLRSEFIRRGPQLRERAQRIHSIQGFTVRNDSRRLHNVQPGQARSGADALQAPFRDLRQDLKQIHQADPDELSRLSELLHIKYKIENKPTSI